MTRGRPKLIKDGNPDLYVRGIDKTTKQEMIVAKAELAKELNMDIAWPKFIKFIFEFWRDSQ